MSCGLIVVFQRCILRKHGSLYWVCFVFKNQKIREERKKGVGEPANLAC